MISPWSPEARRDHARNAYRLCNVRGGKPTARIFRRNASNAALEVLSLLIDVAPARTAEEWKLMSLGVDDDFWDTREHFILRDNYARPPIAVRHSDLRRIDEETAYKSDCPVCETGILLVQRDQTELTLRRDDICIRCWTRFRYTDEFINREKLP